jgi:DNA polymerase-4
VHRTILHIDLDAFFAAVEQRDDPALRGVPVLVGGSRERGVVAAASYEARRFGVHSAMPMAEALRRCPRAIVVPHRMARYADTSQQFLNIIRDFSPLVEALSMDEAFADVTASERLFGDGAAIAAAIKQRVRDELALVASVGVAPNKFVAKIASDIDKPDGLRIVPPGAVLDFLHPLPVDRLWGVGAVTRATLTAMGLRTIGDVARCPAGRLRARLGASLAAHLLALARGDDPRPVESASQPVSIGHEETFERDLGRRDEIAAVLLHQADRVAARLRRARLRARTVTLKLKYADFRLVSRQRTLADATCDGGIIGRIACELLAELPVSDAAGKRERVRLAGVSASGLVARDGPRQLAFDEADRARGERLGDTLDRIHERFGARAIRRAPGEP